MQITKDIYVPILNSNVQSVFLFYNLHPKICLLVAVVVVVVVIVVVVFIVVVVVIVLVIAVDVVDVVVNSFCSKRK